MPFKVLSAAFLIATALCANAEDPSDQWRAAAVKKYPQLGVPGSPFNKAFVDAYNRRKQSSPVSLQDPRWPMVIAEEVDASLPDSLKTAPTPEPVPVTQTPDKPKDNSVPNLTFRTNWAAKTAMSAGGGTGTMEDLKRLLGSHGRPSSEITDLGPVEIYEGVTYLMPLRDALVKLGVDKQLASKTKVACAGFPDGVYYTAFDGRYNGHFNRLYVLTDTRDQVVGVHMVDESPERGIQEGESGGWRTFNFVNARVKSKPYLQIQHRANKKGPVVHIRSELYDPQKGKYVETSHSILAQPLVNAILHCVQ